MSDNQDNYHIKIDGPGLSLDRDLPKVIGEQVVVLVLTGKIPFSAQGRMGKGPSAAVG